MGLFPVSVLYLKPHPIKLIAAAKYDPHIEIRRGLDHLQQLGVWLCSACGCILDWIIANASKEEPVSVGLFIQGSCSKIDHLAEIASNCYEERALVSLGTW